MPTVLRIGAYRFFFYSNEAGEPRHVHVQREQMLAKSGCNRLRWLGATASRHRS